MSFPLSYNKFGLTEALGGQNGFIGANTWEDLLTQKDLTFSVNDQNGSKNSDFLSFTNVNNGKDIVISSGTNKIRYSFKSISFTSDNNAVIFSSVIVQESSGTLSGTLTNSVLYVQVYSDVITDGYCSVKDVEVLTQEHFSNVSSISEEMIKKYIKIGYLNINATLFDTGYDPPVLVTDEETYMIVSELNAIYAAYKVLRLNKNIEVSDAFKRDYLDGLKQINYTMQPTKTLSDITTGNEPYSRRGLAIYSSDRNLDDIDDFDINININNY